MPKIVTHKMANWPVRLANTPTWALRAELGRRAEEPDEDLAVRLPGLTVDPAANTVTWRGDEYLLGGRSMEVLYAIATAQASGMTRVSSVVLARRVFRGFGDAEALANLRTYVSYLRRRFPGLVARDSGTGWYRAYRLVVDDPAPAAEGVA